MRRHGWRKILRMLCLPQKTKSVVFFLAYTFCEHTAKANKRADKLIISSLFDNFVKLRKIKGN